MLTTIAIVLLIAVEAMFSINQIKQKKIANNPSNETVSNITVIGRQACLPHKDKTGPQTLECAIGLKTNDNKYYGLKNLSQTDLTNPKMATSQLEVTGNLSSNVTTDRYDTVGNIDVTNIVFN
jgi:hypothetical protein